jgi:transcriptional regulator with XRE-family HTH domain
VPKDSVRERICSEIARSLKQHRVDQELSLTELATRAGLSRQTVSFIENEDRNPTLDTLLRLTEVLGVELEELIRQARQSVLKR